jgi:anti-sigma-K factor RskA
MIDHEDARLQLADLIVPGLADPTRSAALRAHVAVCPDCQAELADLRYVDGLVRSGGPLPEPSPALEARIQEITGTPRATGRAGALRRRARSITTWRVATIGLAFATAVAGVAAITREGDGGGPAFRPAHQQAMTTAVPYEGTVGTLATGTLNGVPAVRIRLNHAPQPDTGSTFQVWIAQDPKDRIALGTIQPDGSGNASVVLPVPASAKGYRRVWVTNEPNDGNPKWTTDWIVKAS